MYLPIPAAKALELLAAHGFDAYLVGGCVRDYIMNRTVQDFDMTTVARPEQIKSVFADYQVIDTGIKHGTVTVIVDNMPLEITTFRQDGEYIDHRRPLNVTFSNSLQEDLARRDFTVNALAYNPKDGVQDFFAGTTDIQNKLIRAVGDPYKRFEEDALRILRALRFAAVLGFAIEEQTAAAMLSRRELLKNISVERVFIELKKLLCGKDVKRIVEEYTEILGVVLPELLPMKGFMQYNPYHNYDVLIHTLKAVENIKPVPYLRLAALLHDVGKPRSFTRGEDGIGHFYGHMHVSCEITADILNRLHADNCTKDKVLRLVKYHDTQIINEPKYVKRWLHKLGVAEFEDLLLLKSSDMIAQKGDLNDPRLSSIVKLRSIAREIVDEGLAFNLKSLAVCGQDLLKIGVPQGKRIGEILDKLLELVVDGELANRQEELIDYVKKYLY